MGRAHVDTLLPLTHLCSLLVPSSAKLRGRQRGSSVPVSEPSPWPHHRDEEGERALVTITIIIKSHPPTRGTSTQEFIYYQSLDLKFYKWCQPHSCFGILTYLLQGAKKAKPYLVASPEGCCLHRKELLPPTLTCSGSEACSLLGGSPGWGHVHSAA